MRRVRVLINPRSGAGGGSSLSASIRAVETQWSAPEIDLTYQFSNDEADGRTKTRRALSEGVDTVLVVGGDGMVNTIGSEMVDSVAALGVIPSGSGNGFARHFGIPLGVGKAAAALVSAERCRIDVGTANGRPFFVTCSMAWDAAMVRYFEKSPVRGILPYVLAGAYELLDYKPQPIRAIFDDGEERVFDDPLIFTVANLTQYGGGARIAPRACPDDGFLELVVIMRQDLPKVLANLARFLNNIDRSPGVYTRRFRSLVVEREGPADIQLDGELVEAPARVAVGVKPLALNVLVPHPGRETERAHG